MRHNADGPYIVWSDYRPDGWHPISVDTIEEAVKVREGIDDTDFVAITKLVKFELKEVTE